MVRPKSAAAAAAVGAAVRMLTSDELLDALPPMHLIGRYPPLVSVVQPTHPPQQAGKRLGSVIVPFRRGETDEASSVSGSSDSIPRAFPPSLTPKGRSGRSSYAPATFVARGGQVVAALALQRRRKGEGGPSPIRQRHPPCRKEGERDQQTGASTGREVRLFCTSVSTSAPSPTRLTTTTANPSSLVRENLRLSCLSDGSGSELSDDRSSYIDRSHRPSWPSRPAPHRHNVLAGSGSVEISDRGDLREMLSPRSVAAGTDSAHGGHPRVHHARLFSSGSALGQLDVLSADTSHRGGSTARRTTTMFGGSTFHLSDGGLQSPVGDRSMDGDNIVLEGVTTREEEPTLEEVARLKKSRPAFRSRRRVQVGAVVNIVLFSLMGALYMFSSTFTSTVCAIPVVLSVVTLVAFRRDSCLLRESTDYIRASYILQAHHHHHQVMPEELPMDEDSKDRIINVVRLVVEQIAVFSQFDMEDRVADAVRSAWQARNPSVDLSPEWPLMKGLPRQIRCSATICSAVSLAYASIVVTVVCAFFSVSFFVTTVNGLVAHPPPSVGSIPFYNADAPRYELTTTTGDYPWVTKDNSDVLTMIHVSLLIVLPILTTVLMVMQSRRISALGNEGIHYVTMRNHRLMQNVLTAWGEARDDDVRRRSRRLGSNNRGAHRATSVSGSLGGTSLRQSTNHDEGEGEEMYDDFRSSEWASSTASSDDSLETTRRSASLSPTSAYPSPTLRSTTLFNENSHLDVGAVSVAADDGRGEFEVVDGVVVGIPLTGQHGPSPRLRAAVPIADAHLHPDNPYISHAARLQMQRRREWRRHRAVRAASTRSQGGGDVAVVGSSGPMTSLNIPIPPPPLHPYDRVLHTIVFGPLALMAEEHGTKDPVHSQDPPHWVENQQQQGADVLPRFHRRHRAHRPLSATAALRRVYGGGRGTYLYPNNDANNIATSDDDDDLETIPLH